MGILIVLILGLLLNACSVAYSQEPRRRTHHKHLQAKSVVEAQKSSFFSSKYFNETDFNAFVDKLEVPKVGVRALTYALANQPIANKGLLLEFGVFQGKTVNDIAAKYESLTTYGFDSFIGLPERWDRTDGSFPAGMFNLNGNYPPVRNNVVLVKGWYNESLPQFIFAQQMMAAIRKEPVQKVVFLHIDCDLYSSTKLIFDTLYESNMLNWQVVVVFDELVNYSTYREHEIKAFYEFLQYSHYSVKWLGTLGDVNKINPKDNGNALEQSVACVITAPNEEQQQ
jgi:hypothetical protein